MEDGILLHTTRIVIAFKYRDNVRRTLDYRVSDAFADPQASTDNALADLKGTVGSIKREREREERGAFGNGWLLNPKPARSLIGYLVPACARQHAFARSDRREEAHRRRWAECHARRYE